MGMLSQLLTAPLLPMRLAVWAAQRALDEATDEYYDPAPVYAALAELERMLQDGEIDQAAFDRQEDELLDRLDEIAQFRQDAGRDPGGQTP
ncbi:gas vesicle protein [Streptomyces viridochromogenes]|uniref:Gas vesicle protein n=2 Tax=Streptomyces TaxID=1883 RepID=A0A0L8J8A2_STRVR|nr:MULTISPECIES: gas vesicle protein GvpG [Streptomyces]KOG09860.1 gas vesicle protein [Streptomyces viridochromogenes]